jgi:hypothetical protein
MVMERNKDIFGLVMDKLIWVYLISTWVLLFFIIPACVIYGKFFN